MEARIDFKLKSEGLLLVNTVGLLKTYLPDAGEIASIRLGRERIISRFTGTVLDERGCQHMYALQVNNLITGSSPSSREEV